PAPPPAPPAAAAPPPGWSPQPTPPAYPVGTPPPGRGGRGGMGPVLLVGLLLAAVVGAGAVFLVVRPFGDGTASPSPVARATPTGSPSTAAPSVAPTAAPTDIPATPTVEPTAEPTPPPVESAAPSAADVATCRSEAAGITVTYPAPWFTVNDGSAWTCLLFDPAPIEILPDTELPQVAVGMYTQAESYEQVRRDFETTAVYTVISTDTGVVDGRDATAFELENTGQGFYEKGMLQAVVVVDLGARGTLVIESVGMPGAAYEANVEELVRIVESLQID
ncbi:MAG TPA: hypothetical protein VES19_10420, partial [Candidatus Limnocylindrales bacterium]|nr:hypothetical protein [Candidatus Limnocylindrales bacterium]